MSFLCRFLSHRALEKAISIERSTPLPLEASDCFKVRGLEKSWAELTKDGRGEGITPLEHLAEHLKQVFEEEDAPPSTSHTESNCSV
ncbi:955_t:CDS:2 [Paraglomus occultum]|uniref:955_t:CDS:1 n=1 Tax=Paraglomus occultum TaxID=144539 RepID=A0A9N9GPV4_9GLOM|nr:955_t:CDS:2 [Paraglomus occultum]